MKLKILLGVTCGIFCISIFGHSAAWAAAQSRVLVVYYSRTGHTDMVAKELAKKFNADLERLIDQHKRTGMFGVSSAGKDAVADNLTTLEPLKKNPRDYGLIIIGGPSWFGNVTPAVRTFIVQNDLSGKKIALFGLCHLSGVEHALKEAADLISKENEKEFPTLPLREGELKPQILSEKIDDFYIRVNGQ